MKPDLTKYDAVIFDLFHTLISLTNIRASKFLVWDYLEIPEEQWRQATFSDAEDRLRGKISKPTEVIMDIVSKIDPTITPDKTERASQLRLEQFRTALSDIHPHVLSTIKELKQQGKALGLISNADQIEVSGWSQTEASAYFDSAVFSCNVGYIKPEKQIYLHSLTQLGLSPGQCLFVGDGGNDELVGAKNAGMDTAITLEFLDDPMSEPIQRRREQADYEIHRIDELLI
ncbi:MAG: HAD family hydrolase [Arenicellales bacterium]|nr:HAD family hydrolase [Arenicellales bacterium]